MRRFVLDTSICLAYIRGYKLYTQIEDKLDLLAQDAVVIISVVTKAELIALGFKNGWGKAKMEKLQQLLEKLIIIGISETDKLLIDTYARLDAYSQGKLKEKPLGMSARNMGKNDLWIAATAYASRSDLVTLNGDFDHLKKDWFAIHKPD